MKIIECPRDAMQGIQSFIDTEKKIQYLNQLLKVGFDTLDFGSFVSPKAIPQMADTAEVLAHLEWQNSSTKLLAIVANIMGAEQALSKAGVHYLGFPLSISETFQQRNTNKSIKDALVVLNEISHRCKDAGKELVTYISMAFGNPYDDPYNVSVVDSYVEQVAAMGCRIISLSDTVGAAQPHEIASLCANTIKNFPALEIGVHLHSSPEMVFSKIDAAFQAGCKRFDGAIKGWGGCPMANDELVGNIATEIMLSYFESKGVKTGINATEFGKALALSQEIFPIH